MADNGEPVASESQVPEGQQEQGAKPIELRPAAKGRPKKALPTNRIAFPKQLDLLRAFDAASGLNRRPVTLPEVGEIVKMHPNTISLANAFFIEVRLLDRIEATKFLPTDAVHDFAHAYEWGPETAAHKLAPVLRTAWFWEVLEPRLKFQASTPEHDALQVLAETAGASRDHQPQLLLILSFLEAAGLISRDNGFIRILATKAVPAEPTKPDVSPPPSQRQAGSGAVTTSFSQQPEGLVQFAVSVRVDMAELRGWRPERIAAFFAGIAQVLAAKGDVELDASDNP